MSHAKNSCVKSNKHIWINKHNYVVLYILFILDIVHLILFKYLLILISLSISHNAEQPQCFLTDL